jgi:serine/threonine protein kinase
LKEVRFFTEEQVKSIISQLLLSADLFARQGIVHRDLKLSNILVEQPDSETIDVRVADFGFAIMDKDTRKGEVCGTPGFIAPEVFAS